MMQVLHMHTHANTHTYTHTHNQCTFHIEFDGKDILWLYIFPFYEPISEGTQEAHGKTYLALIGTFMINQCGVTVNIPDVVIIAAVPQTFQLSIAPFTTIPQIILVNMNCTEPSNNSGTCTFAHKKRHLD